MKKICFITTIYDTYHDFLKEFSAFLHDSGGYEISLICDGKSIIEGDVPSYVRVYPIHMKRGVSLSAFSAISAIQNIFMKNQFDIVQYSTPNASFYASIAAKRTGIPVRLYCQWGIRYMGFDGWRRVLFKYLEKKTCDNSTFIEAESHNIRDFSMLEGLYSAERSCVIWNGSASGVDLSKFNIENRCQWRSDVRKERGLNEEDIVFAFAGRLTADKGVNELLQAFFNIAAHNRNAKLMIMGGMDNRGSLDAHLMKQAEASDQVIFTGTVNDIERYYAAADIFVAPSYREGFGLVVVEAEAMGLPAVVSDVPGQIDAIVPGKTGLTCKVKDAATLEKAMLILLENSDYRNELGVAAAKFTEKNFEQKKLFAYLKRHRDELVM